VTAIELTTVPPAAPLSPGVVRRHLADLRVPSRTAALLAEDGTGSDAEGPATSAIRAGLTAIVSALASGTTDALCFQRGVRRLVGVGPGLTPTGDDVLVALVATSRRLAAGGLLQEAAADQFAAAVATRPPGRTTAVADHLLAEAAEGRFPQPLAVFVAALGDPGVDRATLAGLTDRLAATGAHSGADWIAGVIALTRVCLSQGGDAWLSA